ncbi:Zinc/iron permease [Nitrosomonas nitrosa]|uniref:Zinc/iron permease n=1 Tax=Nitrosomonas nitrosa TaxID=52442 RepID=A0A8H8Z141_9PROT|nr:ZIP family metal transporter [Nitrosomonas nitrosa]CAE6507291.1 Zinc/iron permease [Nitrosomonas nitrosa]
MDWFTVFITLTASLVVVLVAASSAFVLYIKDSTLKEWMPLLIAVAVGVLLGDAFLHLLPDALKISESAKSVLLWTLTGILCFYAIEQFLHWRHDHSIEIPATGACKPATFVKMNLLGDGIHNFVDGILIAGSFLVDPMLGVATTFAIVMHEIPQEISDIAVLIHGGYEKKRAVIINVLCASACIAGAMLTLLVAQIITLNLSALLAITAGGFIYIATTDLIPLLRQPNMKLALPVQVTATAIGVISMQAIVWLEAIIY